MLWSWFSPSVVLSNNADPWSRSIAYVQIFCQQISSDIQVVVHSASFAWLILQLSPYLTNNGLKKKRLTLRSLSAAFSSYGSYFSDLFLAVVYLLAGLKEVLY